MTTPGSQAGHDGADDGSGPAHGGQDGMRRPGRGRHSADSRGGQERADDREYYDDLYRDDRYSDDRYSDDRYSGDRYRETDRYQQPGGNYGPGDYPQAGGYQETERYERPDRYREPDPYGHAAPYSQPAPPTQPAPYRHAAPHSQPAPPTQPGPYGHAAPHSQPAPPTQPGPYGHAPYGQADRYAPPDQYQPARYQQEGGDRPPQGYPRDAGYHGAGYRGDEGYRGDVQGAADAGGYRGDEVYDSLFRPDNRPGLRTYREPEPYREPRGYSQTGNYDETDLHPPQQPPRRGTVRRYGAARRESADMFPAASQGGAGWIEPDFATGEIAAVDAGWRAGPGRREVPGHRRPGADSTRVLPQQRERGAEPESASLTRSSGVMAIGTLASRGTGLLRTLVQAFALGQYALGNAYNNANTLPNVVYNLVIGGILTSVIVPLLVTAARREHDRGEAYEQRMFTLVTLGLAALTIIATLLAAPLVYLYKGSIHGQTLHLVIILAYFFIPQIFFYGVSSLAGAVLNARGSFAAPMWTPVVNNVVVIVILLMFEAMTSTTGPNLSAGEVGLLGVGTTLGIVAQTAALVPALRRAGFRWRPRTDFRREEVSEIGRMGGWMFGYIAATQVAFLVTTVVANTAEPSISYAGYSAYTYGWQLFQMPYAVVGISVITALLPRMSAHASSGALNLVRDDFSAGVRLASAIVVPCSLVLAVLGPSIGVFLLAHGHVSLAGGRYDGVVFALFTLGLLPYMFFQLQLRVFYALHDSRTPAIIGGVTMVTSIAVNLIALAALPARDVVAGLGLGFGLANLVGAIIAGRILSVRLGGLDGPRVTHTLVRMHVATIPAALFALVVTVLFGALLGTGQGGAFATLLVGGGGALLLYMLSARAMHIRELADLTSSVTSRFRRSRT